MIKEREVRFSGYFGEKSDIQTFNLWKQNILDKGLSLNQTICEIIITHIKKEQEKQIIRSIKDDLFYAIRKAIFASMSSVYKEFQIRKTDENFKNKILNSKLDLISNILFKNIDINDEIFDEPSPKALNESLYFIQKAKNDEKTLKILNETLAKNANKTEKIFDRFSKGDIFDEIHEEKLKKEIRNKNE
ncbi:Mbov_0398 family ICE element protein [Mesomycoplasma neurolyticum]|uniref:ICEF Integrative Conjugal Element-II n=1 Tax=Mesomycoplasma neurolyticum TaxID=2120 RepID=A0A449A5U9_9BACT|nr:hypothetical protein [Mesomycoplasma neurolyticum]VEU59604.1 Putative ICEF Integrative Conjugal Element-II [Mesomycoplasma neurolyticum]